MGLRHKPRYRHIHFSGTSRRVVDHRSELRSVRASDARRSVEEQNLVGHVERRDALRVTRVPQLDGRVPAAGENHIVRGVALDAPDRVVVRPEFILFTNMHSEQYALSGIQNSDSIQATINRQR